MYPFRAGSTQGHPKVPGKIPPGFKPGTLGSTVEHACRLATLPPCTNTNAPFTNSGRLVTDSYQSLIRFARRTFRLYVTYIDGRRSKSKVVSPSDNLIYRAGEAAFTSFCGQRHTRLLCGQHYAQLPLLSPTKARYSFELGRLRDTLQPAENNPSLTRIRPRYPSVRKPKQATTRPHSNYKRFFYLFVKVFN